MKNARTRSVPASSRKSATTIAPASAVKAGDTVFLNDGRVFTVKNAYVRNGDVCIVLDGGTLPLKPHHEVEVAPA